MAESDRFSKRYERKQEEKRRSPELASSDDPPIAGVPVEQAKADQAVGRNDPCPCGSGKKYKKCCGKPA